MGITGAGGNYTAKRMLLFVMCFKKHGMMGHSEFHGADCNIATNSVDRSQAVNIF